MVNSLGARVDELREEARRRRIDDSALDVPDVRTAISAYADLLELSDTLVFDLSLSLTDIRRIGANF